MEKYFDSQQTVEKLKKIQNILFEYYTNTNKILISTERFGDFSNHEIFYNLLGVLDEIFLIIKESDIKNINKRLNKIKVNLLIAQIYAIISSISGIKQKIEERFPLLNDDITRYSNKIKEIVINYDIVSIDKNGELNLNHLKNIHRNEKRIDVLWKASRDLQNQYELLIDVILPKWKINNNNWKGPIKKVRKKIDTEYVIFFNYFIIEEYELSRIVLFDLLRRKGYHYHPSISDIRDAVDHITKSLIYEPNDVILELVYSAEHIRRAAVESIQSYVEEKLSNINDILIEKEKIPKNIIVNCYKAKEQISYARYNKANTTWYYSVIDFYKALKHLDRVSKNLKILKNKKEQHAS